MTGTRVASAALHLDLDDYGGDARDDDLRALDGIAGPVLEIGCGPARLLGALASRGVTVLGIDVSPRAVRMAAERGVPVLGCSVFDRVPAEGRWPTVLLFDGNIGIGGDPVALLDRCAELLAPAGVVVVEVEAPGVPARRVTARLEVQDGVMSWFPWARVGVDGITALARAAGLRVRSIVDVGGRWIAQLQR